MNTRVLIIEDDENLARALSQKRSFEGYETEFQTTALNALRKICQRLPNTVICDRDMPHFDINELLRRVRTIEETKQISFIISFRDRGQVSNPRN